jgi:hypothetical protein
MMTDEATVPTPEYLATLTPLGDADASAAEAVDTGPAIAGCVDMDALHAQAALDAAKNTKPAPKIAPTETDA